MYLLWLFLTVAPCWSPRHKFFKLSTWDSGKQLGTSKYFPDNWDRITQSGMPKYSIYIQFVIIKCLYPSK